MRTAKNLAKQSVLQALKYSGAFRMMSQNRWRHEKLLILCYHGISLADEHEWRPSANMTSGVLESRLKTLKAGGYSVLPLQEALDKLYANTLPPKSVVITFDDGLYNFYAKAFPLLRKYKVPATLYLTTYYCEHQLPVFPLICSYMLWKKRGHVFPPNPSLGFTSPLDLSSESGRHKADDDIRIISERTDWSSEKKNDYAKKLGKYLKVDIESYVARRLFHLVTPKEVKEMTKEGLDIQLHTHRHRTPADRAPFQREITENRESIAGIIRRDVRHHCYPSGVHKPHFLPWLSEIGVTSATTCEHGIASPKTNPLLLPRFLDSQNVTAVEFESWLTGVAPFLRRSIHGR